MFGRSKTVTLLLVIAALGGALILKLSMRGSGTRAKTANVTWTETREERVMLLDLLDRLEAKHPEIQADAEAARAQILDDSQALLVGTTRLSKRFFDWDSLTQESVMLRAIHSPNAISRANRKAPDSE